MSATSTQTGNGTRPLRLLSVVAPVYDEEATIDEFYARGCSALEGLPFELVLVDDGSTDGAPAGLDHASGNAVVMLDADLQDPPELILTMLDHWHAGCDVVYAVREQRQGESRFKLSTAKWFYALFDKRAQVELQHNSGDFRLLDRRALDALLSMRERNRFLRGMTVWVGYTQAAVPYQRDARYAGETKYTLSKMLRFSLDAISSFSHRPLQLATLLGFLISTLAFIAIPVVVVLRIMGSYLPGFSALTIVVLLLGGIELIAIGIMASTWAASTTRSRAVRCTSSAPSETCPPSGSPTILSWPPTATVPRPMARARSTPRSRTPRSSATPARSPAGRPRRTGAVAQPPAGLGPSAGLARPSGTGASGTAWRARCATAPLAPSATSASVPSSAAIRLASPLIASATGSGRCTQSASGPSGRRPSTRTGWPGLPTTVEFGGTSWITTLLAPILAPWPIVIGPSSLAPDPIVTLSWTVGWRLPVAKPVPPSVTPW